MREIKTVIQPVDKPRCFDAIVNSYLADGWILAKRETKAIPGDITESYNRQIVNVLYAELEKWEPIIPEEITL